MLEVRLPGDDLGRGLGVAAAAGAAGVAAATATGLTLVHRARAVARRCRRGGVGLLSVSVVLRRAGCPSGIGSRVRRYH